MCGAAANAPPSGGDRPTVATDAALALIEAATREAAGLARPDLRERLAAAGARIRRPGPVLCVVGEFKQGKSSLVNALLGTSVCPVDDDLATSTLTLLHHAEAPIVHVHRSRDGKRVVETVELAALPELVTERGDPAARRGIQRVDVGLPNPVLARGLVLVDTPGAGGVRGGYASATLAFLGYVDALLFVTDATAELSGPELDFLRQAVERCPSVICAVTKIDVSPFWRRIVELDREHLARAGLDIEVVPVSAVLSRAAAERRDPELADESGCPALLRAIDRQVVAPARNLAIGRAIDDLRAVLAQLTPTVRAELALLEDPTATAATVQILREARERLEHLRGPGARWSQLVGDRMADLSNQATYRFRGSLRAIGQAMDDEIDRLATPAEWEVLGRRLTADVATDVAAVFEMIDAEAANLRREVAELLRAEAVEVTESSGRPSPLDVASLWAPPSIADDGSRLGAIVGQAVTGLRGMQSGVLLLGMIGAFVPAAAGALLLSTPIALGLGIAFGGSQLLDANRRRIAARRQRAKAAVRQFLDEVSFEVGNQLGETIRETQRRLRDEFSERVAELSRTYTKALRRAEEDLRRSTTERQQRAADVRALLARLEALERGVAGLETTRR
ncbi:MAG TPA: dynamin family protein [Candidatus Binatia bacterium]|nr:dynamin family protein [Candidatus Binatia bacterium]